MLQQFACYYCQNGMKRTIVSAILTLSLFSGCSKSRMMERISGKWEYEEFIGYPAYNSLPSGNGRIIILNDDGIYERRNHDTVVFKGKYTIKRQDDCYPGHSNNLFVTDD